MSINAIRLSAYGFRMEAVGGKKFIKREKQMEEYLAKTPIVKVLPTGQLTLFDLFDMSGG